MEVPTVNSQDTFTSIIEAQQQFNNSVVKGHQVQRDLNETVHKNLVSLHESDKAFYALLKAFEKQISICFFMCVVNVFFLLFLLIKTF